MLRKFHGFWWVRYNSYLCSSRGKVLVPPGFFQDTNFRKYVIFCSLKLTCLHVDFLKSIYNAKLSEMHRSVIWCLPLIWGKCSVIIISNISPVPMSSFSWYFNYVYVMPFVVVPQSLDILFCFFIICSLFFLIFKDYIYISSNWDILSLSMSSQLVSPSKTSFISVTVFLSLALLFGSLLLFPFLCLHCPPVLTCCHLLY